MFKSKLRILFLLILIIVISICFFYKDKLYNDISFIKNIINKPINYIEVVNIKKDLLKENNELKKEVSSYKLLENENLELRKEIDEMKKIVPLVKNTNFSYDFANVVFRNINYWMDEFTIDKGRNSGIKVDNVVVSNSLVGKVSKVYDDFSVVSLITSKKLLGISAKINNSVGSIEKYEDGLFILNGIDVYDNIKEKDLVYTTGYGIYNAGILIGEVVEIKRNNSGIGSVVYVKPNVNFNNIRYVLVIK